MMEETYLLTDGIRIPKLGLGTWFIEDDQAAKAAREAISLGYRLIDTAQAYRNEEAVGRAAEKSGIPRGELFITTKVWISNGGYEKAKASIEESLNKLRTDYLDLLLIHQPFNDYYGTYRAMEEAYRAGKIRALGVSNFYPARFIDLAEFCEVKPAVNQMETHVFHQQANIREVMKKYGTRLESWGPFAEGKFGIFTHPVLTKIGSKYGKSAAQVALRWNVQRGVVVIPKSVHKERIEQNLDIWDFQLSQKDMEEISGLEVR